MKESAPTALAEHMNTMLGYWVRQIVEEAVESFAQSLINSAQRKTLGGIHDVILDKIEGTVEDALDSWREGR
jgi:hypothetical protein